ncbi:helix-turn-helix transcriptional regulator [Adhaeribacter sp. BT258]|jgi:hypothetical protein|uniref:Helix-turn-helix transcriptional regulator n=1 Tax=Adhaeribacter terrigena TaxID=2793070 RepID=A0ABS1BXM3_9BACT|nr:helix-turn-helix transcriptional regulator [Adhaeribacter terrigena]MBK0401804.1 helix-turn-helix transcriptional regulator [Adhaeribacter terrigena]
MKKPEKATTSSSESELNSGSNDQKSKKQLKKEDPDLQKLAKRIRDLRIQKGYTNADYFAYEHNITRTQFNRYENGENIKFTSLMKLIKAFGITPAEFFAEGFE